LQEEYEHLGMGDDLIYSRVIVQDVQFRHGSMSVQDRDRVAYIVGRFKDGSSICGVETDMEIVAPVPDDWLTNPISICDRGVAWWDKFVFSDDEDDEEGKDNAGEDSDISGVSDISADNEYNSDVDKVVVLRAIAKKALKDKTKVDAKVALEKEEDRKAERRYQERQRRIIKRRKGQLAFEDERREEDALALQSSVGLNSNNPVVASIHIPGLPSAPPSRGPARGKTRTSKASRRANRITPQPRQEETQSEEEWEQLPEEEWEQPRSRNPYGVGSSKGGPV
jgi:hypothetical protein